MNSKKLKRTLLIVLIAVAGLSIGLNVFYYKSKPSKEVLSEKIEENIVKVADLSMVKYNYTDVVSYNNNLNLGGLDIPFTNKSFIIKYSGYIKAGVDLKDLDINVVDDEQVDIKLGEAKILENVIDEDQVAFFNEQDGLFNKLNYDELYDILREEKDKKAVDTIDEGILVDAARETEDLIRSILTDLGFTQVNIQYISKK